MTLLELEQKLRADARARGSPYGQIWHEADIEGYHLYMADTSFGDGPIFYCVGHHRHCAYQCPQDEWIPVTTDAGIDDLEWILPLAKKAKWVYRLEKLDPLARAD